MDGLGRSLFSLFEVKPAAASAAPMLRDAWLPGIEVMTARDRGGSSGGFFVAAKGGHNAESHNHNDVGTFLVYRDGTPLPVDAEYTLAKSPHEIAFSLLTPSVAAVEGPDAIRLTARELPGSRRSASGHIRIAAPGLHLSVERIPIDDSRMSPAWGDHLNRIVARLTDPPSAGELKIEIT